MDNKYARIIVLIKHISDKMSGVCEDLEKIAVILQDPQIVAITGLDAPQIISKEDYE